MGLSMHQFRSFLAISAFFVFLALRGAKNQLDEKVAPLAGLAAVFIFAMQMINFPVAAGTSGHLIGGALAAILIGPWAGVLAVTVVLIVQALVFADGGLTAIGLNVFIMAVLATLGAWYIFRFFAKSTSKKSNWVFVSNRNCSLFKCAN